jgi:hypothetical protein
VQQVKWRKVIQHPDKEEIIRRLSRGDSVQKVSRWLTAKYAGRNKRKKFLLTIKTLQGFRKDYLNLQGDALQKIKEERAKQIAETEKKRAKTLLERSQAYQEALECAVDDIIDKEKRLKQIDIILSAQIQKMNVLAGEGNDKNTMKAHKVLIEYIKEWRGLVQDWHKIVDGAPDSKTEHTLNINIVKDEISVVKNVLVGILREIDPSLQDLFLSRLDQEFAKLEKGRVDAKAREIQDVAYEEVKRIEQT